MRQTMRLGGWKPKWFVDLAFCTAAYFILLGIFVNDGQWQMIDHIYTSIFLATLILFGTINEWYIQKRFLTKGRYGVFVLLTLLNVFLGALFNQFLFGWLIDFVLPGYYFISYYDLIDLIKFFFVYIFLLTLLTLSWDWFQLQGSRQQLAFLEKEKVTAELKALTNQVNPHFLFNSLNVIYGLALKKSDDTPSAVMKLSETLRYAIYDTIRGKVTLNTELQMIDNYLALQRLRVRDASIITLEKNIVSGETVIEPMLILPLIENAFKHGIMGDSEHGFVNINVAQEDNSVNVRISNNKGIAPKSEGPSGVGLTNIRERLRLLYPGKATLDVTETAEIFTVSLRIETL